VYVGHSQRLKIDLVTSVLDPDHQHLIDDAAKLCEDAENQLMSDVTDHPYWPTDWLTCGPWLTQCTLTLTTFRPIAS